MKVVFIVACLIGLVCAAPVDEEHKIEKRSSSHQIYYGGGGYNGNNMFNSLLPFLILRMLNPPAPAPAPAPAPGK